METKDQESPDEFVADIDGIGQFVFARRKMRLEIKAKVELRRLTEGETLDEFTTMFLVAIADLKTFILRAPGKGWTADELDSADALDPDVYARVLLVWGAFREKEQTFRGA